MNNVLITGGTRGIGRAAVSAFLQNGYRVLFIYKSSDAAAKELEELGARGYKCDLSNAAALEETASAILREEGTVNVLINNAAAASVKLFTDLTDEEWEGLRALDLDAPVRLCRAFIPGMVHEKRGRIINISSVWGQVGASMEVAYSTLKAGLIGLTKALAKELGPSGITVNCICPGVIDTDMNAALDPETVKELCEETPLCRLGTPGDVAGAALFLASEDASFITGQVLAVSGGFALS